MGNSDNFEWSRRLGSQAIDPSAINRLHKDIDELVHAVTKGCLCAPAPSTHFQERVEPLLKDLFIHLHRLYSDRPEPIPVSIPQLSQEFQACSALIQSDIDAALANDPATEDPLEIAICYPGFKAVCFHRVAHVLQRHRIPLLPRLISERAHSATGIDIHPGAEIGSHFFIDHGTGVVIGETAVIGKGVTLYQGVTLGAKRFQRDNSGALIKGQPRHPILQDGVTVYAGATILGRITVGTGSTIGGNVWLTESVPPQSRITQQRYLSTFFIDGDGI